MEAETLELATAGEENGNGSTVAIIECPDARTELAKVCGAKTLDEFESEGLALKVAGANDKTCYELVKKFRIKVKNIRCAIENRRKELKEVPLRFCQELDEAARELKERCEKVEDHLAAQQKIVEDEEKRRAEEEARKAKAKLDERVAQLQAAKATFSVQLVGAMSDDDFAPMLADAQARHAEEERIRAEERERLAKLEAERAEQEARAKAAEAETQRLKDELLAKQRAELAEKERQAQAAEAARLEAERKATEEREAAERRVKAAEEDAARKVAEEKAAREKSEREAREAEERRVAEEAAEKAQAEEAARQAIADAELFKAIKAEFPTLELAWVEIARLRKEVWTLEELASGAIG